MIEVYPNLFVGNQVDYDAICSRHGWYIISAGKEPFHRQTVGYTGRALPKDHPEYLSAERTNRLVLNMIDADDVAYIPKQLVDKAIGRIHQIMIQPGETPMLLIHCNQGRSRSPTIAMLYLGRIGALPADHDEALAQFKTIYPDYAPAKGMADYAKNHWRQ